MHGIKYRVIIRLFLALFLVAVFVAEGKSQQKTVSVRVGKILLKSAIKKALPECSPCAHLRKQSRVEVTIEISREGKVTKAEAISGHPLLRETAVAAARQWLFKPTLIGGTPVMVQGVLTFIFAPGRK